MLQVRNQELPAKLLPGGIRQTVRPPDRQTAQTVALLM